MEEVLSLREDEMKDIYEFIINNHWWKGIKEVKDNVKRGTSKVEGTI